MTQSRPPRPAGSSSCAASSPLLQFVDEFQDLRLGQVLGHLMASLVRERLQ
ncbi:MAG: hypothetical protein WKF73_10020 [Nocardioidaceae bacterium]